MALKKEILPKLLKLPTSERAHLAFELVRSLDEADDADAEQSWLGELERRANEALADSARLEDWAAIRQRIETRLRGRRREI